MTQQLAPLALASTPQQGRKRESSNRLDALSQQREARKAYRESRSKLRHDISLRPRRRLKRLGVVSERGADMWTSRDVGSFR
jgi:hypothetical protein